MKKALLKLAAIILAVCMLAPLAACSTTGTVIMEYGKTKITANMYQYWLSRYKALLLSTYSDMEDTQDFWTAEVSEGVTYNALFSSVILRNIQTTLVCAELFDQYGLKIDDASVSNIDSYIQSLIDENANGSRSAFNQIISAYGVNANLLREIYLMEEKVNGLYDYYYGEGGTETITDEDREAFLETNYVHIMHLFVNNVYEYEYDENGANVYDTDGNAKIKALTGEALDKKNAAIAEIDAAFAEEDYSRFNELWEEYSDDKFYPNGYYVTTSTSFIAEVLTAAFSTEVGKVTKVSSDYGVHYVMGLALEKGAYADTANADFFEKYDELVGQSLFQAEIDATAVNVTLNEAGITEYSLITAKPNYNY